jgi:hypothetical protein
MTLIQRTVLGLSNNAYRCNSCGKLVRISKWGRFLALVCIMAPLPLGFFFDEVMGIRSDALNVPLAFGLPLLIWALGSALAVAIFGADADEKTPSPRGETETWAQRFEDLISVYFLALVWSAIGLSVGAVLGKYIGIGRTATAIIGGIVGWIFGVRKLFKFRSGR